MDHISLVHRAYCKEISDSRCTLLRPHFLGPDAGDDMLPRNEASPIADIMEKKRRDPRDCGERKTNENLKKQCFTTNALLEEAGGRIDLRDVVSKSSRG